MPKHPRPADFAAIKERLCQRLRASADRIEQQARDFGLRLDGNAMRLFANDVEVGIYLDEESLLEAAYLLCSTQARLLMSMSNASSLLSEWNPEAAKAAKERVRIRLGRPKQKGPAPKKKKPHPRAYVKK